MSAQDNTAGDPATSKTDSTAILLERARHLAIPLVMPASGSQQEVLLFALDKQLFALPLSVIHAVLPMPSLTRLPDSPAQMRGIINYRGSVLPVVDLRAWFNLPAASLPATACLLVAGAERPEFCIVADSVSGQLAIPEAGLRTSATSGLRQQTGVDPGSGRVFSLLDGEALLQDERLFIGAQQHGNG